jgi:hypothetical protein
MARFCGVRRSELQALPIEPWSSLRWGHGAQKHNLIDGKWNRWRRIAYFHVAAKLL